MQGTTFDSLLAGLVALAVPGWPGAAIVWCVTRWHRGQRALLATMAVLAAWLLATVAMVAIDLWWAPCLEDCSRYRTPPSFAGQLLLASIHLAAGLWCVRWLRARP